MFDSLYGLTKRLRCMCIQKIAFVLKKEAQIKNGIDEENYAITGEIYVQEVKWANLIDC